MRPRTRVVSYCWQIRLETFFILGIPWGALWTRKIRERVLSFFADLYALTVSSRPRNIHLDHEICKFSWIRSTPLKLESVALSAYGFGFLVISAWSWDIRVIHVFILRIIDFLIVLTTDAYAVQSSLGHCSWSARSANVEFRSQFILARIRRL